jgi:uncharacterized metal-binding protein YceD (DUF177 family)
MMMVGRASGASPASKNPHTVALLPFIYGPDPSLHWQAPLAFETPELEALVEAHLTFNKTSTGFTVKGTLTGKAKAPCTNCVGNTWVTLEADDVNERFALKQLADLSTPPDQQELLPDDFYELVDANLPFDVAELIRQLTIMALPPWANCELPLDECPTALAFEA